MKKKKQSKRTNRSKNNSFALYTKSNKQLASMYKNKIGYNPFKEGWTRKEVIEILSERG